MGLLLLSLLSIYHPENWQAYPSMDEVRSISATGQDLYVAVPGGVYIFDRGGYRLVRTLTQADGLYGEVTLCAHNPSRGDVYITTEEHIYRFVPATGLVTELLAPFKNTTSIGIAKDGAYFETDAGMFFRSRSAADFAPVSEPPNGLLWYGRRDTLEPRDYPFLTPYFVMDDQLLNHQILRVRPDKTSRRVFVTAQDYGILVYGTMTGFSEAHIRLGPSREPVRRIAGLDNRLWFISGETSVALDSAGDWQYFLTRPGDLPGAGFRLLLNPVTNLNRSERIFSVFADSGRLFFGTDFGLYLLGADRKLARLLNLNRRVNGMVRLHDSLLFGTDQGLFLLSGDSAVAYNDPYGRTDWGVYDMARSNSGSTWFGVVGGVVARDPTGAWFRYVPPGFDLKEPVKAVAASGTRVFMGSKAGITVLDTKDKSWDVIDAARGLPVSEITSLYADSQYLWIASDRLIARLDYTRELK